MIDYGGSKKRPGKKKIWLSLVLTYGVSALLGIGGYYGYRYYCESINDGFLRGTIVDGEDVYGLTPAHAADLIADKYADSRIVITEGENVDLEGNLASYGYEIDRGKLKDDLQTVFLQEKGDKLAVLKSVFDRFTYHFAVKPAENTEVFEQRVQVSNLGVARYPSKDAYLYYEKESDCIAIKEEIQGNEISDEALRAYVRECIAYTLNEEEAPAVQAKAADEGTTQVTEQAQTADEGATQAAERAAADGAGQVSEEGSTLETENAPESEPQQPYEEMPVAGPQQVAGEGLHRSFEFPWNLSGKPAVYADDAELTAKRDAINEYAGAGLTYTFGEQKEEYNLLDLAERLMEIEDGKAELSDEKITAFVEDLADRYNTRYRERTFESTLAGEITISAKYNDYGYTIIQADEIEQIREDIESREHVAREPVYLEKNSWGNPYYLRRNGVDDLAGTYIEVDLTAQHVWYYKNGELCTETDCVSGDVTNDHGTQTGCFPLAYKESPSVLTGGEGDEEYEEKVEYWMPFFEGQGLHDASWRYYFGGRIYRGNGSHGCVNLPVWAAAEIYNAVEVGTPILIFYE